MKVAGIKTMFFFLFLSAAFVASAQKKQFRGLLVDKNSGNPVSMAGIRNVNSGTSVITHRDGSFLIDASQGSIIAVTANGYFSDTLSISDSLFTLGSISFSLQSLASTLQDVTVTSQYNHYQLDSIARRRHFLQTVGEHKIPTVGRTNSEKDFGIALNLDHFSKREKSKREARSLFELMEEEAYINFRWNENFVNKYTQYKDDELTAFMQKARPPYEWLRSHQGDEDLLYYINSQLKKFRKH